MSTKSIDEVFGKEERGHAAFGIKGSIDSWYQQYPVLHLSPGI